MNRRARRGQPKRQRSKSPKSLQLRIFCEGAATEKGYFTFLKRQYRERVQITVDDRHGEPLTLVKNAIATMADEKRSEKRGRGAAHDQYWCVFDRDEHGHFDEAIGLAHQEGIQIACSNPCIELWFIIHFEDQTAFIDRHAAQRRSRLLLKSDKVLSDEANQTLHRLFVDASERAKRLETKHEGDGSPPNSNPSSRVWTLLDTIRNA